MITVSLMPAFIPFCHWKIWIVIIGLLAFAAHVAFSISQEKRTKQRDKNMVNHIVRRLSKARKVRASDSAKIPSRKPGSRMTHDAAFPVPLPHRMTGLAERLFGLLREQGTILSAFGFALGYGRFKAELQNLVAEMRKASIQSGITDSEIAPPVQTADGIRAIADKLLLTAVEIDLNSDSKEGFP